MSCNVPLDPDLRAHSGRVHVLAFVCWDIIFLSPAPALAVLRVYFESPHASLALLQLVAVHIMLVVSCTQLNRFAHTLMPVQCLAESFGVDPDSESDKTAYSLAPASLLSLLDVYLKTKAKATGGTGAAASSAASASASTPSSSASATKSEPASAKASSSGDAKTRADALKAEGNALMSQKLYESAIEKYTEAINIDSNPVYYSNRAAAWGGLGEHDKAVEDAEKAIELDEGFAKAYSRLG